MPVLDFPFPMPPRRGRGSPGLQPPHPASGRPPDPAELLREMITLQPPHPSTFPPEELERVRDVVNNPQDFEPPPEMGVNPANKVLGKLAAGGIAPGARRALIERFHEALLQELDAAFTGPGQTMGHMFARQGELPTMQDIYASSAGPARPSEFFQGTSPIEQPDLIQARVNELLLQLEQIDPAVREGEVSATEQIVAEQTPLTPELSADAEYVTGDLSQATARPQEILHSISVVAQAARDNDFGTIQAVMQAGIVPEPVMMQVLLDAFNTSGLGSGRRVPGLDPAASRSLAPDLDPQAVAAQQAPGTDTDLILQMLGLGRMQPRGGV